MKTFEVNVDAEATFIGTAYPTAEEVEGFFRSRGGDVLDMDFLEDPEDGLTVRFDLCVWGVDADEQEDAESEGEDEAVDVMAAFARRFGLTLGNHWIDATATAEKGFWDEPEDLDGGEES